MDHPRASQCSNERALSVTVVIVSYNTCDLLERCLAALLPQLSARDHVVVVDNASQDDSAAMVRARFPSVRLVERSTNVGFGRACNQGASEFDEDLVLLLNPDAELGDGAIDALQDAVERRPDAGIYGGRSLYRDGSTDPRSCWGAPTIWSTFCFATGLSTIFKRFILLDPESLGRWDRTTEREVDMVSGALMMVKGDLWKRLDGFDPRFFMYGEDLDLCLRARQLGALPLLVPTATMFHEPGASSTRADMRRLLLAGKITAMTANNPGWKGEVMRRLIVAGSAMRALLGRPVKNSWSSAWSRRSEWSHGYPPRPSGAELHGADETDAAR